MLRRLTELLVLEISGDVGGEAGDPADVAAHCSWHTLIVNGLTFPASAWEWLPVPVEGKLAVRFDEAEGLPLPVDGRDYPVFPCINVFPCTCTLAYTARQSSRPCTHTPPSD